MTEKSINYNIIWSVIRQVASTLLPIVSIAYAARILGAEQMGVFSFSFTFVNYFFILSRFGISNYAVREGAQLRDNQESFRDFVNEMVQINLIFTSVSFVILLGVTFLVKSLYAYSRCIVICSMVIPIYLVGTDWINYIFEDFKYLAIRYLIVSSISLLAIFFFVKLPDDANMYAFLYLMSSYGGMLFNVFYHRKHIHFKKIRFVDLKKHFIPMAILLGSEMMAIIFVNIDITMMGLIKGDYITGIYSMAARAYNAIIALFSSVLLVILPRFSYQAVMKTEEDFFESLSKILNALLCIVLPCAIFMFMESYEILYIFAGVGYADGAVALKILSLALLFSLTCNIIGNTILLPMHLERVSLIGTIAAAGLNFLLNLFFINKWGMEGAAVTTLISHIVNLIIISFCIKDKVRVKVSLINILQIVLGSAAIVFICIIGKHLFPSAMHRFTFKLVVSFALYFVFLLLTRNQTAVYYFEAVKKKIEGIKER